MKTKEILVENLNCWFLEHSKTINTCSSEPTVLEIKKMKYVDYLKICHKYPMIYLGNNLVTKYNTFFEGYVFMPTVEFAEEEKCYIRNCDDDFILSVIINSYSLSISKKDLDSKDKKIESKTYLMIDGNNFIKIGRSYSPIIRERTLQSQNPTIKLIAFCEKDVEKELHLKYHSKRKRGEWFFLSKVDIKNIIKDFKFVKIKESEVSNG